MKILRHVFLFLTISLLSDIYAQKILYSHSKDEVVDNNSHEQYSEQTNKEKSKLRYNLNMGTSVSISDFGNAMHIFTEPELRYRLNPKLSVSTGFLIVNSTVSGLYSDKYSNGKKNITRGFVTASLDYNATERLRISGEILYGMNKSPFLLDKSERGAEYYLKFSAEYKITENITFGIQIINQQTNLSPLSPYYNKNLFLDY